MYAFVTSFTHARTHILPSGSPALRFIVEVVGFPRYKPHFLYIISDVERNVIYVLNPARVPL
jgi:hypothetical protein